MLAFIALLLFKYYYYSARVQNAAILTPSYRSGCEWRPIHPKQVSGFWPISQTTAKVDKESIYENYVPPPYLLGFGITLEVGRRPHITRYRKRIRLWPSTGTCIQCQQTGRVNKVLFCSWVVSRWKISRRCYTISCDNRILHSTYCTINPRPTRFVPGKANEQMNTDGGLECIRWIWGLEGELLPAASYNILPNLTECHFCCHRRGINHICRLLFTPQRHTGFIRRLAGAHHISPAVVWTLWS